jgi:hypothetical protein
MPLTTSSHTQDLPQGLPAWPDLDSPQEKLTRVTGIPGNTFRGAVNTVISSTGWNNLDGPDTKFLPDVSLELAPEQVTDLLAMVAAPMALAGISLAGAPMTAMAMVVLAPLAALFFWGRTPEESPERQPPSLIDVLSLLFPDLEGDDLKLLADKIEPHRRELNLATVIRNTREALNCPSRTPRETITHLRVNQWVRAARNKRELHTNPTHIAKPMPLTEAITNALTMACLASPVIRAGSVSPSMSDAQSYTDRQLAYEKSVANDLALATNRQLNAWPSRPYQVELERRLHEPRPDRQDPAYRRLPKEGKANMKYAHEYRTLHAQMRLDTLSAENNPGRRKNIRLAYDSELANAKLRRDTVVNPAKAIREYKLHKRPESCSRTIASFEAPTTGHAGALTDFGIASPSTETTSSIFPAAASAVIRPPLTLPARAPESSVNVALLSGRAYRLQRSQQALEEALPGWMLAEPGDQQKTRDSLLAYKRLLPQLAKLEKDVAAIPHDMEGYFNLRIKNRFGLKIDSRNATLQSQTWRTRRNWDMAGTQPVPQPYFSALEKKTINRSLWEAAKENFNADEVLPEFLRGDFSAEHISVAHGPNSEIANGPGIRQWIEFVRGENLGDVAQDRLDNVMKAARSDLLRSYPIALRASLDVAEMGGLPTELVTLLRRVLKDPYSLPVTPSGRLWQVSPLHVLDAEMQALVFHTDALKSSTYDTHTDGGVLYIPNVCLDAFSSAEELGNLVEKLIGDPARLALLAERVPLDMRDEFVRAASHAAQSGDMRDLQISLGENLPSGLWNSMYQREVVFRKRNLETLIKPTAKVDKQASIDRRMALYGAAMGLLGSFSGLPLVGPIFMGPNLAAFANSAMDYFWLRGREGAEAANTLLPDLLNGVLSIADFDADDARSAVGRLRPSIGTGSRLPSYFRASDTITSVPSPDSRGLIRVNQRTYIRMDSDDLVEVNASEAGRVHAIARWQSVEVSGPEVTRQPDGRWSPKPEGVDSLTSVELFRKMLPEDLTPWEDSHIQGLIGDLGFDQEKLRAIWDGQSQSSLLVEHMARYQYLVDLDALPGVLTSDSSPVPQTMLPVIAQALADLAGRPLEVYRFDRPGDTPSLKARYAPHTPSGSDASPMQVVEKNGVEYLPLASHAAPNQAVPNRLSLIDSVMEIVPSLGVNPSRWRWESKGVRRAQTVSEVIDHLQKERATFQQLCLEQIVTPPASLDAPSDRQSQLLRTFPGIPVGLLEKITTELDKGDAAGGPIDMGQAGRIVMDHYAQARRNDILFRLRYGPHTAGSEATYLRLLVTDPHWPKGLAVEVIPSLIGYDGSYYRDTNQAPRVYGESSSEQRRLQLYHRNDGTYAPIASSGSDRGDVHPSAGHAPDDLGMAILLAMEPADYRTWTSDSARSDVNGHALAQARRLDNDKLDYRTQHETGSLAPETLSQVAPASISLVNRAARQDGTYEVDGKIYLYAYGKAYRLKKDDEPGDIAVESYRIVSADSSEDFSDSPAYAGLDYSPMIVRDEHGAWKLDTTDRLWTFHKLGAITKGIDVTEARALLDVTDISALHLQDIQLGKKGPSPELGDAIIRARMRSVIRRLQNDASHFNDLQDPTPVLVLLTKLDDWPSDTALEVSDEDGQVSVYGYPDATKAIRIGLEALQPPLLKSLHDLLGSAFLGAVTGETSAPSLLARFAECLGKAAGRYPSALLDSWYVHWQDPDSMLAQELMRNEPGLTKLASEEILTKVNLKRKVDLLPDGKLADDVRVLAQAASTTTRIHRLKEALRTGRVVTTNEKVALNDLLTRLPGWEAGLAIDANGDIILRQDVGAKRIRQDGEQYQVIDASGGVIAEAQDIYAAISLALDPAIYAKLGLAQTGDNALRKAVWKQAGKDKDVFRHHVETPDETNGPGRVLCRVRRMVDEPGCSGAATIPQAAQDARDAVVASQASLESHVASRPQNRRSSTSSGTSATSRSSASSARSQTLGQSNFASLLIQTPIKAHTSRETVKFPKMDETRQATGSSAMVSRSSGAKESPSYFIFASHYNDADLPKMVGGRNLVDQVNMHREGISVPGRHFKYNVKLAVGDKLALDRPSDTEAALLEYVSLQLQSYKQTVPGATDINLTGKLAIYTELTPCNSCQNIVRQFRSKYPNIQVDVYFSFKNSRERNATPLRDADIHLWTPN